MSKDAKDIKSTDSKCRSIAKGNCSKTALTASEVADVINTHKKDPVITAVLGTKPRAQTCKKHLLEFIGEVQKSIDELRSIYSVKDPEMTDSDFENLC